MPYTAADGVQVPAGTDAFSPPTQFKAWSDKAATYHNRYKVPTVSDMTSLTTMTEGDRCYVLADDSEWYYNGTAWKSPRTGMNLIKPSSAPNGTMDAFGVVSFSAITNAAPLILNGVFTSEYRSYKVIVDVTSASAAANISLGLALAGAMVTPGFDGQLTFTSSATALSTLNPNINDATWQVTAGSAVTHTIEALISSPAVAALTRIISTDSAYTGTGSVSSWYTGGHRSATAYDGLVLQPVTNNITGTIRVYGLA